MPVRRKIQYVVFGDVHLGHEKNRTSEIIRNIDTMFGWYTDKSPYANVDAIFVEGDLLDRLLSFSSKDVLEIQLWLGRIMRFCAKRKIVLRFLKGTPSHDRDQVKITEVIYDLLDDKPDFRYIDVLHVEHIEALAIDVLYVPDEWTSDTDLTLRQAKELIHNAGLQQVDIAIMHGAFRYQLPMAPESVPKHNEGEYLSLVKHWIHVGHIHNFSKYERIIAAGSTDRIAHGEEDPKGMVVATISPDGDSFDFIENKGAKIFKTIELKNPDVDKSMEQIRKIVLKLPDDSYVRIKSTKDHPVYQAFEELKLKFPLYNFTKSTVEDERDEYELINNAVAADTGYTPIHITRDNIVGLVRDAVTAKYPLTDTQLKLLNTTLESTNAA